MPCIVIVIVVNHLLIPSPLHFITRSMADEEGGMNKYKLYWRNGKVPAAALDLVSPLIVIAFHCSLL
jgi:hypothetical protein